VLEVRVMSPRIAWHGFLSISARLTKLACILAVVTGCGWGVWQGVKRAFYQNPDFRLQIIDLNPNSVIDELGLAEKTGIDLTASLFDIKVSDITAKLLQLPEISAAHVERHLPGKLVVRVTARSPQAWISCPAAGLTTVRQTGAMLVDTAGIAYPCPDLQLASALSLPVIELPLAEKNPVTSGKNIGQKELAHCLRLLTAANDPDSQASHWIESIKQINEWSLLLTTCQGTAATFSLGDHPRQLTRLRAALDHAAQKGYLIDTINLIPKHNIPVTVRTDPPAAGSAAPATPSVPVPIPSRGEVQEQRRNRDLRGLLDRN
jgi:POTRA domain, FtsQ-type